jgi:hypothetical protein
MIAMLLLITTVVRWWSLYCLRVARQWRLRLYDDSRVTSHVDPKVVSDRCMFSTIAEEMWPLGADFFTISDVGCFVHTVM